MVTVLLSAALAIAAVTSITALVAGALELRAIRRLRERQELAQRDDVVQARRSIHGR
jgi:hypothetical protein